MPTSQRVSVPICGWPSASSRARTRPSAARRELEGSAALALQWADSRALFYATVEQVIVPGLEATGLPARASGRRECPQRVSPRVMRASVRAVGVEVAFGDRHILKGCDLTVEPGDRVGLVGANGCGKSTFLRILAGHADPDLGEVQRDGNVGYLAQEPVLPGETVGASADDAIQWHRDLLEGYEAALARDDLPEAARLQGLLDRHGWSIEHQIDAMLTNLGAPRCAHRGSLG